MQHGLFRRIAEVDIIKAHITLQGSIGDSTVMMLMFPRPKIGAFFTLAHAAIGIFLCIYQGNISFVAFRLFIQQGKNAVRTRKPHDHHIHLIGHLPNRTGELLGHIQKRHYDADAERHAGNADVGHIRQQQYTAYQGYYHIHYVADIAQKRHQNIGKAVSVAGIEKDLSVYLIKIRLDVLLMAKYLDHFLPGHHLFHKRLGLSQSDLLTQKIFGGMTGDITGRKQHTNYAGHYNQAQNNAVIHHDAEYCQQRHAGDQHLRQTLADHLTQGIHIVGVITHNVAVSVSIKIFNR